VTLVGSVLVVPTRIGLTDDKAALAGPAPGGVRYLVQTDGVGGVTTADWIERDAGLAWRRSG
jgi:hypothetical protein